MLTCDESNGFQVAWVALFEGDGDGLQLVSLAVFGLRVRIQLYRDSIATIPCQLHGLTDCHGRSREFGESNPIVLLGPGRDNEGGAHDESIEELHFFIF